MEGHQGNHNQFQSDIVPSTAQATPAFSSSDSKLQQTHPPFVARWPSGPGPIKPPLLIMPDTPVQKRTSSSLRYRSGLLTAHKPKRKTTKSRLLWTMASIVIVLGVMVGVTLIDTKVVADVMFFQVNPPHAMQSTSGNGIVFPLQRFDLSYPTSEQALEVLVKTGEVVKSGQALVRLSHHGLLISPISGIVTAVNINPDELFSANARLLTVMDETAAIVHTKLPLAIFGRVTPGLAAEVSSAALPGHTFEGTVSTIVPQADTQTDTFEAWVRIDNQKEVILPGMKVSVQIAVGQ